MSRHATGLRAWFLQRISAVYLTGFSLFLLGLFLLAPPVDFAQWQALMAAPAMQVASLLFFVNLLIHAWVGFRDVLIDYVPLTPLRLTLLSLLGFGLIACGLWAALVIFHASIG
jgi:succinate dehydrogenase / fumarate reductase membrane anchor subunit